MPKRGKPNYHEKRCINCEGLFHSVRSDAKYCGDDCKSYYRYHVVLKNGGNINNDKSFNIKPSENKEYQQNKEVNQSLKQLERQYDELRQEAYHWTLDNKYSLDVLRKPELVKIDEDYNRRLRHLSKLIEDKKENLLSRDILPE